MLTLNVPVEGLNVPDEGLNVPDEGSESLKRDWQLRPTIDCDSNKLSRI
jgi:hypothetical protein